jgi:hypothetical protein
MARISSSLGSLSGSNKPMVTGISVFGNDKVLQANA